MHLRFLKNSGLIPEVGKVKNSKILFFLLQSKNVIHRMREVVDIFEMNLDRHLGSVLPPFVNGASATHSSTGSLWAKISGLTGHA